MILTLIQVKLTNVWERSLSSKLQRTTSEARIVSLIAEGGGVELFAQGKVLVCKSCWCRAIGILK